MLSVIEKYLRDKKIEFLYRFAQDLHKDFGIKVEPGTGFTMREFFYFAIVDGKRFVHKDALRFVHTNGDTFFPNQNNIQEDQEVHFNNNPADRKIFLENSSRLFDFFRHEINCYKLFPELLYESEHFFVFKYYDKEDWEILKSLTLDDAKYILNHYKEMNRGKKEIITPFLQEMTGNLLKNFKTGEIKMIDLKCLEFKPNAKLTIFFQHWEIDRLYILEPQFSTRKKLLAPYEYDFITLNTKIVKLYKWFSL